MDKIAFKHFLGRMWKEREEQTPPPQITFKNATIMIADDSRTVIHALKKILMSSGYETIPAFDGEQAVEVAMKWKPDLILMDIVMPRMNGFEATRALAQDSDTADIPIIIVSGEDRMTDRMWATRLGAKGFLSKPIQRKELISKIGAVLAYSQQTKEKDSPQKTFAGFEMRDSGLG